MRRMAGMVAGMLLLPGWAVAASAPPAAAASKPAPVDCAALQAYKPDDAGYASDRAGKITADAVLECRNRGWDPSPYLVNGYGRQGAVAEGAGGFSVPTIQAPNAPPKTAGAPTSVGKSTSSMLPGLMDLLGKITITYRSDDSSDSGTSTASSCPVRDDMAGAYGALSAVAGTTKALSCGGTVPLTSYRISLVDHPTGFIVTEYNVPYIWIYVLQGGKYTLLGGAAKKLPAHLCTKTTLPDGTTQTSVSGDEVNLSPQAQMITYNASAQSLALRLVQKTPDDSNNPFAAENQNENYLTLPIVNGVPTVPQDASSGVASCDSQQDYYKPYSSLKTTSQTGEMILKSSLQPGCEADAESCAMLGESDAPTSPYSCDVTTLYPGSDACAGRLQYVLLDRPNLLFPFGSTVTALAVDGRTSAMVYTDSQASNPARLIANANSIVYLNRSTHAFTFPEAAVMGLPDSKRLRMNPGAIVDMNGLQITLTRGGYIMDSNGNTEQSFSSKTKLAIDPSALPVAIQIGRQILMPPGYAILSQPPASVREPMVAPK